jgi:hypothetical protein
MKGALVVVVALVASCAKPPPPRAPLVALADVEQTFGKLVTAGNHPTPDQKGTGDRLGLFLDDTGTLWGLPLTETANGDVLACAPDAIKIAPPTGTYPSRVEILGATNAPTGWRGGTGKLELIVRDNAGRVRSIDVDGAEIPSGPVCWAQEDSGFPQQLQYYRLTRQR